MNKNRRTGTLATGVALLILGVLIGVGYLLFDAFEHSDGVFTVPTAPQLIPTSTTTDTPEATAEVTEATAEVIPTTLYIPSKGIRAPVVEVFLDGTSWDVRNLGTNVGHLQGTAWIDSPGNIVLSGHVELADGRQGVFATIEELQRGDIILLQHGGEDRRYSVRTISSVEPDDLSVLYPTQTEQLTLITCDAYDFLQNAYLERVVVVADRID